MTTTTTTTVSLVSLEKALVAIKKSYDKANSVSINLETEEGVKAKASKDAKLVAQENIVLAMIKNGYTVSMEAKAYYDLVLERLDTSKAEIFPVLDHEGKVLDFLYAVNKEMHVSSGIVLRFWNMTKRILSLSWYYTGRYVVNGLVYVWNKVCDLWSWIKSKFSKSEVPTVAPTTEAIVEAPVAVTAETATPVATPVVEEAPVAAEAVVEVCEVPVVEVIVEEVAVTEIPVISEELLAEVEGDLVINSTEELDAFILGDEATEIVVATQSDEVSPLEIFEVIDEVTAEETVAEVAVTEEAEVTVEVATVEVVADAIPAALTAGAPAPKAPNTKVKPSRPKASKPKAVKATKAYKATKA